MSHGVQRNPIIHQHAVAIGIRQSCCQKPPTHSVDQYARSGKALIGEHFEDRRPFQQFGNLIGGRRSAGVEDRRQQLPCSFVRPNTRVAAKTSLQRSWPASSSFMASRRTPSETSCTKRTGRFSSKSSHAREGEGITY